MYTNRINTKGANAALMSLIKALNHDWTKPVVKIGTGIVILRYYGREARKPNSWLSIFHPNLQKPVAVKRFKENLARIVDKKDVPHEGLEVEAIRGLLNKFNSTNNMGERSIRELYNQILQCRIVDDDIYKVIAQVSQKHVVNVSHPKRVGLKYHQTPTTEFHAPLLEIHAEDVDHVATALKSLQDEVKVEDYDGSSIEAIEQSSNVQKNINEDTSSTNINMETLRKYLQKAEADGKQRKQYAWENQKRYNWDQRLTVSSPLSPVHLFFSGTMSGKKRRSRQPFTQTSLPDTSINFAMHLDNEPKELLVYNLRSKSKHIIPSKNDNSIFNINYKDLFGVINSSGFLPEETLSIIDNFEKDGWILVGDLYDNSESLVFQRVSSKQNEKSTLYSNTLRNALFGSIVAVLAYGLLKLFAQ